MSTRTWTEATLRDALARFCEGKQRMCVPPQSDDHDLVLADGIDELVAARSRLAHLEAELARVTGERDEAVAAGKVLAFALDTDKQERRRAIRHALRYRRNLRTQRVMRLATRHQERMEWEAARTAEARLSRIEEAARGARGAIVALLMSHDPDADERMRADTIFAAGMQASAAVRGIDAALERGSDG